MAYDLLVAPSRKSQDASAWVGSVEFSDLPSIARLLKKIDSSFLQRVSNLFEDEEFSVQEISAALAELLPLLEEDLQPDAKIFLHKVLAVLAYANWKQFPLFAIAD